MLSKPPGFNYTTTKYKFLLVIKLQHEISKLDLLDHSISFHLNLRKLQILIELLNLCGKVEKSVILQKTKQILPA